MGYGHFTPGPHRVRQRTRKPRSQRTKMGLMYVFGCVHTEMRMCHHDHGCVPTPNVRWCMVCDAMAHAVWPRGDTQPVDLDQTLALLERRHNILCVGRCVDNGGECRTHGARASQRELYRPRAATCERQITRVPGLRCGSDGSLRPVSR